MCSARVRVVVAGLVTWGLLGSGLSASMQDSALANVVTSAARSPTPAPTASATPTTATPTPTPTTATPTWPGPHPAPASPSSLSSPPAILPGAGFSPLVPVPSAQLVGYALPVPARVVAADPGLIGEGSPGPRRTESAGPVT